MDLSRKAFELATDTAIGDTGVANQAAVATIAAPGVNKRVVICAYGFSANVAIPAGGVDVTLAYTDKSGDAITKHHRLPAAVIAPQAYMGGTRAFMCSENSSVTLTVPAMTGVIGSAWIDYFILPA